MSAPPLFDAERIERLLDESELAALVFATPANVLHATRFPKAGGTLAVVERVRVTEPTLVVPAADLDFVLEDLGDGVRVAGYGSFFRSIADEGELSSGARRVAALHEACDREGDRFSVAANVLRSAGLGGARIGLDGLAEAVGPLVEALPDARFTPVPGLVRRLRMVKTDEEVRRLAAAAHIAEDAIDATVGAASAGATQDELARTFAHAVAERSARVRLANVSLGPSTALGNVNVPGDVLRAGDLIRFDVGAVYRGYASDVARCFALGSVPERADRYYRALLAGQEAALEAVRPGAVASEVFRLAVDAVRRAGIGHYGRTNVGHGIGIAGDGYDAPLLAESDGTVIEVGTTLCVETPYYELGFGGLQVEDMIVVRPGGWEPLTRSPRELRVIS